MTNFNKQRICLSAVIMCLAFTACGGTNNKTDNISGTEIPVVSTTPAPSGLSDEIVSNDFVYLINYDDREIKLTGFCGTDKKIDVPAMLDNMPVVELAGDIFAQSDVEEINISANIRVIDPDIFRSCEHLKTINTSENNKYFCSVGGVLYSKDLKQLIFYPKGRTDSEFVVPDSVEKIARKAFDGAYNLEKIVIGENVTSLVAETIYECPNLTSIILPEKLTSFSSLSAAKCGRLKCVTAHKNSRSFVNFDNGLYNISLTRLIIYPAGNKSDMVSLPDTLEEISGYAFCGNSEISEIIIPESVTAIGCGAFMNTGITRIYVPDKVSGLGAHAFENCKKLVSAELPDGLTVIEDSLFENCISLIDVKLGNNITEIGCKAFKNATAVEELTLPPTVNKIGDEAFAGMKKLKSICLACTEKGSVGEAAFKNCEALEAADIRLGIKTLEDELFCGCLRLKEFNIPDSVTKIDDKSFMGCASLEKIDIPDSVLLIRGKSFSGCSSLKEVNVGKNCKYIHKNAFKICNSLNRFILEDKTVRIDEAAFDKENKIEFIFRKQ